MTAAVAVAAGAAALLAVFVVALILQLSKMVTSAEAERDRIAQRHAVEVEQWAAERLALLNRIQRPDVLAAPAVVEFTEPEPELDESHLVGQIHLDPEYGLDAD